MDRAAAKYERERAQLDLVLRYGHHDELAAGCKTGHKRPHGTAAGGGCENRSGPAYALQYRCGIVDGGIDVDVRAQILRQLFLLASAPDCDSMESHAPRKLNAEMPEAADALHGDQISAAQAGVAKGVVGRDARAEERGGFHGPELVGNGSDGARFGDHHLGISSIHGDSRYHGVLTVHDVSAPARLTDSVFAAEEADADPLADFPSRHSAAQGFNAAGYFMPGHAREIQTRVGAGDRSRIGVTDSTGFHPNPDLARAGLGNRPLRHAKPARLIHFHCFVCVAHLNLRFSSHLSAVDSTAPNDCFCRSPFNAPPQATTSSSMALTDFSCW